MDTLVQNDAGRMVVSHVKWFDSTINTSFSSNKRDSP